MIVGHWRRGAPPPRGRPRKKREKGVPMHRGEPGKNAKNKIKLEIDYDQNISTILKDSKGDPSKKKLSINVIIKVKSDNDNILVNQRFNEEFSYDVQSDKFSMTQYENNIVENLSNKISNDIVFLLNTLE